MSQDKVNQPPQKPYQSVQPIWKAKIIQILRGTIGVLETTVDKLETAPPPGTEETPSFLQQVQLRWGGLLRTIRLFLPSNLSTKVSDSALTGIVTTIAVILVWTTATVLNNKPVEIATFPPVEEVPAPTVTTPPESPAAPEQLPEEITPPPPEPKPTPPPIVELTPEQTLIASIQNQVGEISDRFADHLIKSIQANFRSSNLSVKISDDWYTLKESEQNKLAAEILQRAQELDFSHLEIIDSQNRLIARNPVVGNQMIIFQRIETSVRRSI